MSMYNIPCACHEMSLSSISSASSWFFIFSLFFFVVVKHRPFRYNSTNRITVLMRRNVTTRPANMYSAMFSWWTLVSGDNEPGLSILPTLGERLVILMRLNNSLASFVSEYACVSMGKDDSDIPGLRAHLVIVLSEPFDSTTSENRNKIRVSRVNCNVYTLSFF